ncbi:hypothetical protein Mth01_16640 [Sphaerimonospora thailandensis]|uniref:Uncharacterized protein n=1 Tax=Sphaerimonospora thailandensis TaxID=795644 RepID=A0A8J3R7X0_9ACTN|nr:hypothetical protein Mth01_16640 [Sphaerimonospora thailandensis]
MGYELRRWLADRLPAEISSGERLVALEIADQANDDTRLAYGKGILTLVARRTGYANEKQVRKTIIRLAGNRVELRVPISRNGRPIMDKNGRPVFAYEGHETTYRIPTESECPALVGPLPGPLSGTPSGVPLEPRGTPEEVERDPAEDQEGTRPGPSGTPDGSPFSSYLLKDSSSLLTDPAAAQEETRDLPPEAGPPADTAADSPIPPDLMRAVTTATGATPEEVARVLAAAERDGIRNPPAWLASHAGRHDFPRRLAQLRRTDHAGTVPTFADYQATVRAACDHGTPGGPSKCPLCRRGIPAEPPGPPTPDRATPDFRTRSVVGRYVQVTARPKEDS